MSQTPTTVRHDSRHGRAALDEAWALLLALNGLRREGGLPATRIGAWLSAAGELHIAEPDDPRAQLISRDGGVLVPGLNLPPQVRDLFDLYLPVIAAGATRAVVVGHLGQSIDANIATESGDSCYVNGRQNLIHLHRMRALCDAIVVGAGTVAADDPRLTTRLVEGPNPVRVVIDPQRRLPADRGVFTDGETTTLIACEADRSDATDAHGSLISVPGDADGLSLAALLAALQRRGLHALFVEGGGVTVTRWMKADLLDHLQIATAPVFIGAGRPGLRLPPALSMDECLRPAYRVFRMGEDLLWDFDLRAERAVPQVTKEEGLAPLRLL